MKTKYFLLGFTILSIITLSTTVQAASYKLSSNVKENTKYVWKITSFDATESKNVLGVDSVEDLLKTIGMKGSGIKVGAQRQSEITDIKKEDDSWLITYDDWDYTNSESDLKKDPDDKDQEDTVFKDPDDVGEDLVPILMGNFIPTPVVDYLKAIDWAKGVKISGSQITQTVKKDDLKEIFTKAKDDAKFIWEYDSDGVQSRNTISSTSDKIIMDVVLQGAIPGYEISLLLGITAIFTIGLVYIIKRRI